MSYFDVQVNGYGGIDFNQDDLSAEDLHSACRSLRNDEVGGILATIITETPDKMVKRLGRLVQLRNEDPLAREMIAGFHIEGPFLSPVDGYRGAHPLDAIRPASEDLAKLLVDAGDGLVRIFTLAPEQDHGLRVTQMLSAQDIMVSAGHTNASVDQLRAAIDCGLGMFTHLGNGCPMNMPRHDNIIQRALSLRKDLWLCFIADGIHIPFHALRNYLDLAMEAGRCIVTTDAIAAAGLGPGQHRISRWNVTVGEDFAVWADDRSHLVGSAVPMKMAARNLIQELGLDAKAVQLLTSEYPRVSFDFAPKGL